MTPAPLLVGMLGQVTDAVSGEGIEAAILTLTAIGGGGAAFGATSNPGGEFVFPGLPPGPYRLAVTAAGWASYPNPAYDFGGEVGHPGEVSISSGRPARLCIALHPRTANGRTAP